MSFFINSTKLKEAYFNGSEVSSIYYNNTLVWEASAWPGWANATWEDVYNLCISKQNGDIDAWPEDVVLGATKTVTLSTAVLGSTSAEMMIIGLDIDGSGVITFQSKGLLLNATSYGASTCIWNGSYVRNECQNFYNYCEAKPYIKTLSKAYYYGQYTIDTKGYMDDPVWVTSEAEMGLSANQKGAEYTNGVSTAYPYLTTAANRIKYDPNGNCYVYWTRTVYNWNKGAASIVLTDGSIGGGEYGGLCRFAPCFAIG